MKITKHFVTVGNRRVHYHRAGDGPAVVLLHASPCSAKVLRLPLETFAQRFTAIAFDTPGFGLSDLLPMAQPETEDLADALADTLAALGIEQAAAYGRHTGAQIAVEFAARHRQRCAMALTDGFPIFSAETKKARLESYLAPIVPSFDGGHLLWLWFRYRDQHVFWPWNEQRLSHRADSDVPDLDFLHRGVIELLEAGDSYRVVYATAYRHRGLEALRDLKVPVCFGARPGDNQLKTLQQFPQGTWTQEMPRDARAAALAELEILTRHPAKASPPAAPACAALAGRSTTDYVDVDGAQMLVRSVGRLHEPVIIVHHAPGSSALYDELVRAIGAKHPALAFDLPGHGESDPLGPQSIAAWTDALLKLLDRMLIGAVHLYGHNGGAAVAVEAALRAPRRIRTLLVDAPIAVEKAVADGWLKGVEPVTPAWNGEHLLRVWHMRRDMELWWPWYDRRRENARAVEPRIDPARLTIEVGEAMKRPASFAPAWRAVMEYPMRRRLAEVGKAVVFSSRQDVFARCVPQAQFVVDTAQAKADFILQHL
ncbi:MAG TPA: alpha/beta fold hydrolase [Burkholderiales bacterium]|nr:alpha/beta fold hydrolase [Burkholderiales bacterium]